MLCNHLVDEVESGVSATDSQGLRIPLRCGVGRFWPMIGPRPLTIKQKTSKIKQETTKFHYNSSKKAKKSKTIQKTKSNRKNNKHRPRPQPSILPASFLLAQGPMRAHGGDPVRMKNDRSGLETFEGTFDFYGA